MTNPYTKEQLKNFRIYEEIRKEGLYNMFDPNARALTGMTKAEYIFVIENYSGLSKAAKESSND